MVLGVVVIGIINVQLVLIVVGIINIIGLMLIVVDVLVNIGISNVVVVVLEVILVIKFIVRYNNNNVNIIGNVDNFVKVLFSS